MQQPPQPLTEQRIDLLCIQLIGDLLDSDRIGTREDAVVERFVDQALLIELPFEPLMTVQAELGRVRKNDPNLMNIGPKSRSTM